MTFDRSAHGRRCMARRWAGTTKAQRIFATEAARRGFWAKLYEQADPDGSLDAAERRTRAEQLWLRHLTQMGERGRAAQRTSPGDR